MIQALFNACVWILIQMAHFFGTSYEAINIWIFVVIHPALTIYLFYLFLKYRKKYLALIAPPAK
ncbi:MAG: hypothetical protein ORN56_10080 [Chitinophagales bacterium]|nr:hypothetical protein [Chitinophagales bacterium]